MDKFEQALKFTLPWEGGFVNDPADLGGATNHGVTQRTYDGYRVSLGQAKQPVKNITLEETRALYKRDFWTVCHGEEFIPQLGMALFDTIVNFNTKSFRNFCARAVGYPDGTGYAEIMTKMRGSEANQKAVALRICDVRIAYRHFRVGQNPTQQKFLAGWLNRDNALKKAIEKLV